MTNGRTADADAADHAFWRDHSTIVLSPVAAPSILGLFGFAAATFMVAANMAGWYGSTDTPLVLFPFALTAGGIAQFLAGMWAYRARDAIATAMHGIWGSFWIAYGLYTLLITLGALPPPTTGSAPGAFGLWFVVLAAITWVGTIAATADNTALTGVLLMLAAGSTLLAIALLAATPTVLVIGAYLLIISALIAWYLAAAMMLHAAFNRPVLPIGKRHTTPDTDVLTSNPIQYAAGEPGVKAGQ